MNIGINIAAANEEEIATKGLTLNIQEAVSETTSPFEKSLAKL